MDSVVAPVHGRRELPVSVDRVAAPMPALVREPEVWRGDVHARLGHLVCQQPPPPVDAQGPGAGLYRVPARCRLGERASSPPLSSPPPPPSSVGLRQLGR
jgi:hypothetical protein